MTGIRQETEISSLMIELEPESAVLLRSQAYAAVARVTEMIGIVGSLLRLFGSNGHLVVIPFRTRIVDQV